MNKAFLLIVMVFLHIVDDYYLQGVLASMKQKIWWKKNAPEKLYKFDYIPALIVHATSWAFMIMIPVFVYNNGINNIILMWFFLNIILHAIIDDLKANRKKINLITDQCLHLTQIFLTWICCCCL